MASLVSDSADGNSARGDWAGQMPGVVRPLFKWTTRYEPNRQEVAAGSR